MISSFSNMGDLPSADRNGDVFTTAASDDLQTNKAKIRYDQNGCIKNYTKKTAVCTGLYSLMQTIFLLKEKDDLLGSNVLDLVDPGFVQALGTDAIRSLFKLTPLETIGGGLPLKLEIDNIVTGVRSDGSSFEMRVDIIDTHEGDYIAVITDLHEDSLEETVSSLSRHNTESLLRLSSFSVSGSFGGLVVDVNEREKSDSGWIGTGRYVDGVQELESDDVRNVASLSISNHYLLYVVLTKSVQ